jgi:putative PIN family toxin of toxin-antitoxin system
VPAVVLIDTNVWVSALISPHGVPARLLRLWLDGHFEAVVSLPLLDELADVLSRPRITHKYPIRPTDVQQFLELLVRRCQVVEPTGSVHECRDPDDDLVLETALLGRALFVITRDDDLKRDPDLMAHLLERGVQVLSVQQFRARIDSDQL